MPYLAGMQFSWQDVLSLLGAAQGILLALLLFTRRSNQRPNRVLGLFTLLFSLGLLERFMKPHRQEPGLAYAGDLLGGTTFLYAPLVYIFLHLLLKGRLRRRAWLKHLAPFILYTLGMTATHVFSSSSAPAGAGEGMDLLEALLLLGLYLQIFFYSFLSIRLVIHAEAEAGDSLSLSWLKALIIGLTGIYGLSFLAILLAIFGVSISQPLFTAVQVACVVMVYLLSYFALVQPQLAYTPLDKESKYQDSSLSESDKKQLLERILRYMQEEKPYLEPNLTIEQFASQLEVNRYYISQVVNECLKQNFSDFLNAYRVEAAKAMLMDPALSHFKILAIAYEAGFNSKTSFNTTFKKLTGMSPSQYRKSGRSST